MINNFSDVAIFPNNEKWEFAIKRETNEKIDKLEFQSDFNYDIDKLIISKAYNRLKHKTQVFFCPENDHVCTRIEHVNSVESISYNIAKKLGLNVELTKAIAIAHDLGHSPYGHEGEEIISVISEREINKKFYHSVNGLYYVDNIELMKNGKGQKDNLHLTYAVRDGIIAHSGKINEDGLKPRDEVIDLNNFTFPGEYNPYTWEGCVVKIADNISYLGRDIEDAITMGFLNLDDVKELYKIIKFKPINNSSLIKYFISDLCENSSVNNGLKFSKEALDIMNNVAKFNKEKIYKNEKRGATTRYFTVILNEIFYTLKREFEGKKTLQNLIKMGRYYPELSSEFVTWLSNYCDIKERNNSINKNKIIYDIEDLNDYCRAILDYISGMTDKYIVKVHQEIVSF